MDNTIKDQWDGYEGSVRVIKSEETKYARHHLKRIRQVGDVRREGRLVMGYQPAFCCQFEKCCLNMPQPVSD